MVTLFIKFIEWFEDLVDDIKYKKCIYRNMKMLDDAFWLMDNSSDDNPNRRKANKKCRKLQKQTKKEWRRILKG